MRSCSPACLLMVVLCLQDSQVIRVSFSSLFREFKSTATWLQFPFICEAGTSRKGEVEAGSEEDSAVRERQPGSGEGGGQAQAQG